MLEVERVPENDPRLDRKQIGAARTKRESGVVVVADARWFAVGFLAVEYPDDTPTLACRKGGNTCARGDAIVRGDAGARTIAPETEVMEHALDVVADDRAERQVGTHMWALTAEHDRGAVGIAIHDQSVAEEICTVHAPIVDVGRQRDRVPRAMGQPRRNRS